MARIILTDVALNGVKDAKVEKPTKKQAAKYKKLFETATAAIIAEQAGRFGTYHRAQNCRTSPYTESITTLKLTNNKSTKK